MGARVALIQLTQGMHKTEVLFGHKSACVHLLRVWRKLHRIPMFDQNLRLSLRAIFSRMWVRQWSSVERAKGSHITLHACNGFVSDRSCFVQVQQRRCMPFVASSSSSFCSTQPSSAKFPHVSPPAKLGVMSSCTGKKCLTCKSLKIPILL